MHNISAMTFSIPMETRAMHRKILFANARCIYIAREEMDGDREMKKLRIYGFYLFPLIFLFRSANSTTTGRGLFALTFFSLIPHLTAFCGDVYRSVFKFIDLILSAIH